jgi:hypothetical protein
MIHCPRRTATTMATIRRARMTCMKHQRRGTATAQLVHFIWSWHMVLHPEGSITNDMDSPYSGGIGCARLDMRFVPIKERGSEDEDYYRRDRLGKERVQPSWRR